jgi:hypothetical protein
MFSPVKIQKMSEPNIGVQKRGFRTDISQNPLLYLR